MALFNILVDIAAKTASFESGIKRVEDQLSEFGENVKKALEFAGISLGIKELISKFDEFAEHAESMSHAAEKTGLAVEELSRLQFAATQTGVSADSLTSAIEKFAKVATEATAKSGQQSAAFAAIGVAVTDSSGAIKPLNDLLGEVANRFESYRDSAEKTALAQILFGKSGADMIPVLNLGSQAIEQLGKRSDELGNTISQKTAKAAEEFNNKLGELKGVSQGLWQLMAEQLLPTFTKLVDGLVAGGSAANKFTSEIEPMITGLKILVDAGYSVYKTFSDAGRALGAMAAILTSPLSQASTIWKEWIEDAKKSNAEGTAFLDRLWGNTGDVITKVADTAEKSGGKLAAPIVSLFNLSEAVLEAMQGIEDKVRGTILSNTDTITKQGESALNASLAKMNVTAVHFWDQLDALGQSGAKNVQSAFSNFLFDPVSKGFGGLVVDFANALRKMAAEAAATDIFRALFGSDKEGNSGLGGFFSSLLGAFIGGSVGGGGAGASSGGGGGGGFGGARADGGPIESGKWYIAGEHGPEPIWGGGSGAFATGYGGGGGSPVININTSIDARGATVDLMKVLPTILKQNNDTLEAKIVQGYRRGKYS